MAGGWRVTVRAAAAALAGTTASRPSATIGRPSAEPARPALDPGPAPIRVHVMAQDESPHDFGPEPIIVPAHGIGFRSAPRHAAPATETQIVSHGTVTAQPEKPVVETIVGPDPTPTSENDEEEDDLGDAPPPRHAAYPTTPAVDDVAAEEVAAAQVATRPGRHRREHSAISGTVRSTRGRGLRGMQVAVLDESWQVVATAVTGIGGAFTAEELPPGTYRVTAIDELDGDFGTGWYAGTSVPRAGVLRVKEGRTRRNTDITLASTAEVKVDVDIRRTKAVVGIRVTERGTGIRAKGSVRVSTKRFGTELPLTKGRTALTLLGSAGGSPTLGKKVTVDYLGTKHVLPGSTSVRLR
jgi:hypothetical protein